MSDAHVSKFRVPLVTEDRTYEQMSADVLDTLERPPSKGWLIGFSIAALLMTIGFLVMGYQVSTGIGVWGLNKTVGWSWDITNFVFWVGIGHAGTLISAILLIFRQRWRTAINRSAEAMTIFAVACAGLYPLIHAGRPWLLYWVFPYPNTRGSLWVNFRSPLLWDVVAISTYLTVSLVFWYMGLLPDLATIRDRTKSKFRKMVYGIAAFGWDGSNKTWHHFEILCLILAGLATPLVLSVHTIVSMDFATSVIPGWHTTIFPPYFVAGAIFSGFAMVLTLLIIARKVMNWENYITMGHIEAMCKVIILTGTMVGLAYGTEFFIAWYSGNEYEQYCFINRATGPYWWAYWSMISCNVLSPQFLWFKKLRTNLTFVFILSIFVNIGMWFERFVIITTSLHRDFLPSSWAMYSPTWVEIWTFIGTFGLFFTLFFLFIRLLPGIAVAEVKSVYKFARNNKK
ncbi:MAG: polysulfide reductase NrfD [Bacteriovoracaceae bacterium]|jgi:molybdopterin-containing oxidoreductase family membrane subunit|nr:polysulfide reductase NrfD [Bacteriovoracaceae bacterium]